MIESIEYTDIENPNLNELAESVVPKTKISGLAWDENTNILVFYLCDELTTEEKTKLYTIVNEIVGGA